LKGVERGKTDFTRPVQVMAYLSAQSVLVPVTLTL